MKIKKLSWFAVFSSFTQYCRDRKIGVYIFANLFSCFVPGLVIYLIATKKCSGAGAVLFLYLWRVYLAPFDDYASSSTAISELYKYPLSVPDIIFIRFVSKTIQISEWIMLGASIAVYCFCGYSLPFFWGVLVFCAGLASEEAYSFVFNYLRKAKIAIVLFYILHFGLLGLVLLNNLSLTHINWFFVGLFLLSVLVLLGVAIFGRKLKYYSPQKKQKTQAQGPLSSRVIRACLSKGPTFRHFFFDLVLHLKLKPFPLISALGYSVVFYFLDGDNLFLPIIVLYFIVDYGMSAGFNYLSAINDSYGRLILSPVIVPALIRGKNAALSLVMLIFSSLLTLALGLITGLTPRAYICSLILNVHCVALVTAVSAVLSIMHFHLDTSKKKHTALHFGIMVLLMVSESVLSTMLQQGGVLGAIVLVFVLLSFPVLLLFCFGRMDMLGSLYEKKRDMMQSVIQEAQVQK